MTASFLKCCQVTPYAGVWIEMFVLYDVTLCVSVTPYAGVWIEITGFGNALAKIIVTPYAGVWIEMSHKEKQCFRVESHSLRGSVD